MAYPVIDAHRILYNKDGTSVGYNETNDYSNGIVDYLTQADMDLLQHDSDEYRVRDVYEDMHRCFWWFFPHQTEITWAALRAGVYDSSLATFTFHGLEGSNNTTNGLDGTWEAFGVDGVLQGGKNETEDSAGDDWWRSPALLTPPVGGNAFTVVRARIHAYRGGWIGNFHLYGRIADGVATDDIVFLESDGTTPYTGLHNYGSTEEGQTYDVDMYLKNTSTTFTANDTVITLGGKNPTNITFSIDDGVTYVDTATLLTLAPEATQLIKVRNTVGTPPQNLSPRNAYIRTVVTSWT